MKTEKRIKILEKKLLTPRNFSIKEYLNFGSYSVLNENDRLSILSEFEKLTTEEQQQNLSILWALQPYRDVLGFALHITCGKRTHDHELRKGRTGNSVHLWGAVDTTCNEINEASKLFNNTWIGGFKHYEDKKFIHTDIGRNRSW